MIGIFRWLFCVPDSTVLEKSLDILNNIKTPIGLVCNSIVNRNCSSETDYFKSYDNKLILTLHPKSYTFDKLAYYDVKPIITNGNKTGFYMHKEYTSSTKTTIEKVILDFKVDTSQRSSGGSILYSCKITVKNTNGINDEYSVDDTSFINILEPAYSYSLF